jgi:prophage maintenance system killer protein
VLDGALGRAQNYMAYTGDPAQAAAALAHGVGQAQAFEDGNKRTAFHLAHAWLDANGYGYAVPPDDVELADHLIGYGEGTHTMDDTATLMRQRIDDPPPNTGPGGEAQNRLGNILDPIHDQLDPSVWDNPGDPQPQLRHEHMVWIPKHIFETLDANGYDNPEQWLSIVLTGSLTTYQYSPQSDCDVSLWVDAKAFPEWSRAEMIGLMISHFDGINLPGTTHEMQGFVVASKKFTYDDLYQPGLRSAYIVYGKGQGNWLVPPEKDRVHNVEREENEAYTIALENADKMDRLLRYEPHKAVQFWHQIHKRRQRDQVAGKGDFSPSNITYKFLENRGLMPRINEAEKGDLQH